MIFFSVNSFSQKFHKDTLTNKLDYDLIYTINNFPIRDFVGVKFPNVKKEDIYGVLFESNNSKRLVLYNFWHKQCAPCLVEIDMLNQLQSKFSNQVDFIGITFETKDDIIKFNEKYPFHFRQLSIAQNIIMNLFVYSGFPATYLVFDGEIIAFSIGGPKDTNSTASYISLYSTYSKFRFAIESKLNKI